MDIRKRLCGILAASVCTVCIVACGSEGPVSTEESPLSDYDIQMNDDGTADYDPNGTSSERAGQAKIASFQDSAIASCWVTLDWCDTPWISPHPVATCHSTGCGCAYAKQVCASLVSQHCGAVRGYGNDCR